VELLRRLRPGCDVGEGRLLPVEWSERILGERQKCDGCERLVHDETEFGRPNVVECMSQVDAECTTRCDIVECEEDEMESRWRRVSLEGETLGLAVDQVLKKRWES
jgi:hypothetical protein